MLPIVPASGKRGAFLSGNLSFDGNVPKLEDTVPLKDALMKAYECTQEDDPIVLLDVDGFSERFLNGEIVKEVRIRGRDLWFVTYVENLEDVISALTGSFSGLGIPMHTVREENLMKLASEMTELAFPAAFIRNGREISTGRRPDELEIIMRNRGEKRLLCIDMDSLTTQEFDFSIISDRNLIE